MEIKMKKMLQKFRMLIMLTMILSVIIFCSSATAEEGGSGH